MFAAIPARMIPKTGNRFSEEIMRQDEDGEWV